MKKKLTYLMTVCAVLMAGFTGCSDSNDDLRTVVDGEKGSLTFSISAKNLSTKALSFEHENNESNVKSITVFVFSTTSGALETVKTITNADFTKNVDTYTVTSPKAIEVFAGSKDVYIGANMPASLISAIQQKGQSGMKATSAYEELVASLTALEEFTMFCDAPLTATVVTGAVTNIGSTTVSRLAAKLSVFYNGEKFTDPANVAVAGGKLDLNTLEYAVENTNPSFRINKPNGTTEFSPAIDWNVPPALTPFQTVVAKDMSANVYWDVNHTYITENIPDVDTYATSLSSQVTYARIQCQFIPSVMLDGAGTLVAYTAGDDFYALRLTNNQVAYFSMHVYAAALASLSSENSTLSGSSTEILYKNGICNYGVFPTREAGKYDIVRNHYYIVTISAINGIGQPTDPSTPITPSSKGDIEFEITVNNWIPVDIDDEQLPG